MRTIAIKIISLCIVMCLSYVSNAQEEGTLLLLSAAHCLAAKNFLPLSKAKKLSFGYLLDEKSYPSEDMLYVVTYPKPTRAKGIVFTIFVTDRKGGFNLNVQNNASFVLTKDDEGGVFFVTPPLGGTWTQEHLISAIEQIQKQPTVTIAMNNLLAVNSSVGCEAYTDPQPKATAK